ncbi:MAG: zf-TFIIB domain-containing protein [Thermodesulfobacteriota bacterium]
MPYKPSEKEEEYFARKEFEKLKKIEDEKQKKLAAEERQRLKDLHFMHCPKCGLNLVEIDYRGIKIDKCSGCEGVWLDAGELESAAGLEKSILDKFFGALKK